MLASFFNAVFLTLAASHANTTPSGGF